MYRRGSASCAAARRARPETRREVTNGRRSCGSGHGHPNRRRSQQTALSRMGAYPKSVLRTDGRDGLGRSVDDAGLGEKTASGTHRGTRWHVIECYGVCVRRFTIRVRPWCRRHEEAIFGRSTVDPNLQYSSPYCRESSGKAWTDERVLGSALGPSPLPALVSRPRCCWQQVGPCQRPPSEPPTICADNSNDEPDGLAEQRIGRLLIEFLFPATGNGDGCSVPGGEGVFTPPGNRRLHRPGGSGQGKNKTTRRAIRIAMSRVGST